MRIEINFSPREQVYVSRLYVALVLVLLAGMMVFYVNYSSYRDSEITMTKLARDAALLEKIQADTTKRLTLIKSKVGSERSEAADREGEFANEVIQKRVFSWTGFLNKLEELVPAGVGISDIKPDFATLDVDINGTALSMGQLMDFVDRLTKSRYFDEMPPTFHSTEKIVDKDIGKTVQDFSIKIRYFPEGRDNAVAAAASTTEKMPIKQGR